MLIEAMLANSMTFVISYWISLAVFANFKSKGNDYFVKSKCISIISYKMIYQNDIFFQRTARTMNCKFFGCKKETTIRLQFFLD